jgi:hypothetical protein
VLLSGGVVSLGLILDFLYIPAAGREHFPSCALTYSPGCLLEVAVLIFDITMVLFYFTTVVKWFFCGCVLNIDFGFLGFGTAPINLQAELSFNLPLELLKMVASESEN